MNKAIKIKDILRLREAAPVLLAALDELVTEFENLKFDDPDVQQKWDYLIENAMNAMKKASEEY